MFPGRAVTRRRAGGRLWLLFLIAACVYDDGKRCGPGEVLDETEVCVCAANYVPNKRPITVVKMQEGGTPYLRAGCRPCGPGEVAKDDACVCAPGSTKTATGCVKSLLGATCKSDADCTTADSPFCRLPEGYCTSTGCKDDKDCNTTADYACDTSGPTTYCKRPPVGQGKACTMQGLDPACSMEAPVCALNSCHVAMCKTKGDCSPSRTCCDVSKFAGQPLTLCMTSCL